MRVFQYCFVSIIVFFSAQSYFESEPACFNSLENNPFVSYNAGFSGLANRTAASKNAPTRLTYNDLRSYRFGKTQRGAVPPKLKSADGKIVNIAGYMIPLNEAADITEFMLIQYPFFGCCYSIPPEPNETVLVSLPQGKATEYVNTPIRVIGRFRIDDTQIDGYVVSMYRIEIAEIHEASANDPDVKQHQGARRW